MQFLQAQAITQAGAGEAATGTAASGGRGGRHSESRQGKPGKANGLWQTTVAMAPAAVGADSDSANLLLSKTVTAPGSVDDSAFQVRSRSCGASPPSTQAGTGSAMAVVSESPAMSSTSDSEASLVSGSFLLLLSTAFLFAEA